MIKLLFIFLFFSFDVFAKSSDFLSKDKFYIGVDATKNDKRIGKIDNSVAQESVEEDRYYGYKFGNRGFFVAPEVSMSKVNNQITQNYSNQNQHNTRLTNPMVNYNVRANVGYDFNKYFSGFITYDVARFSLDSTQRAINANLNNNGNLPIMGLGSQINISNDFGVKFFYMQQQFQGASNGNAQVNSQIIKVGTVYNF